MINYQRGAFNPRSLFQIKGSVFPWTLPPALLCGLVSFGLKFSSGRDASLDAFLGQILQDNSAYSSFSVLIGFLIIFRTQQSYSRFWDGSNYVKTMQAEYFVTGSNLIAFSRQSTADADMVRTFQQVLVRLLSLLHAVSLAQLRGTTDNNWHQELIDLNGIDRESIRTLWKEDCKVELIVQWLQSCTVDAQAAGVVTIAPPILSRIFQNLSNGLSAFYSASRVTEIPYPFPYLQTTEVLLFCQLCVTPVVMCNFTSRAGWAGVFSFLSSFILLSLNKIAVELEDPFGTDPNDLDLDGMQHEMNKRLLLLMRPTTSRVPKLSIHARDEEDDTMAHVVTHQPTFIQDKASRVTTVFDPVERGGSERGSPKHELATLDESTADDDDCVSNGIPDLVAERRAQYLRLSALSCDREFLGDEDEERCAPPSPRLSEGEAEEVVTSPLEVLCGRTYIDVASGSDVDLAGGLKFDARTKWRTGVAAVAVGRSLTMPSLGEADKSESDTLILKPRDRYLWRTKDSRAAECAAGGDVGHLQIEERRSSEAPAPPGSEPAPLDDAGSAGQLLPWGCLPAVVQEPLPLPSEHVTSRGPSDRLPSRADCGAGHTSHSALELARKPTLRESAAG